MVAPDDDRLRQIYGSAHTIAVVGASADPAKAGYSIPAYLQAQGYEIIPVNPKGGEILGRTVRTSLADIGQPIDIVDVFRPAEETPDVARAAVAAGAKVLWLQAGIHSDEAQKIAEDAGLTFVSDICLGATHARLGLGPGPD